MKSYLGDAAEEGVHALRMRYVDLVCGTRRQKPHICPSDGMVDVSDSKSDVERRAGSSPALGTRSASQRPWCWITKGKFSKVVRNTCDKIFLALPPGIARQKQSDKSDKNV